MVFVLCFDGKKVRNLGHVSSEGSIFVYNSTRRPIKLRSDWEQLTVHNVTITDLQFYPDAKSTSITTVHRPPLALFFFLPVILLCHDLPSRSILHPNISEKFNITSVSQISRFKFCLSIFPFWFYQKLHFFQVIRDILHKNSNIIQEYQL